MTKDRQTATVFQLSPEREEAFWNLVARLKLDPVTASAATLVKHCCERGRDLPAHAEGHGAACELSFHLRHGASIQFLSRPVGNGTQNESGMGAPVGTEVDHLAGVV